MDQLQARNEKIIQAPVSRIWSAITDIQLLPNINPGVITATGRMDQEGLTRTCEINTNGRQGTMVERLVQLTPEEKTVWALEQDNMGMSRLLKDTRFSFTLEKLSDQSTRVISETYYTPASFPAKVMNLLMLRKQISRAQAQILNNLQAITER